MIQDRLSKLSCKLADIQALQRQVGAFLIEAVRCETYIYNLYCSRLKLQLTRLQNALEAQDSILNEISPPNKLFTIFCLCLGVLLYSYFSDESTHTTAMAELKPVDGTDVYLWKYLPSIPAAIAFLALFTLITIAHTWRMVKTQTWFTSAFVIGGVCT
jgi:hypothetical protein